jgi:hypothetical protein
VGGEENHLQAYRFPGMVLHHQPRFGEGRRNPMINIDAIVSNGISNATAAPPSQVSAENQTPAELLAAARVRPTDTIEADPVVLWVKGEPNPVEFGTLGNFSMITGKAKSKKTFTICLAIAPAIDGSQYNVGPFEVRLPSHKRRVVYFDTEQGRHRVWRALDRVCRMAGITNPPDLEYYDLRGYDTQTRVAMIDFALNEGNPGKDIGLVVVDGCRDLVHDFNDPKDATKLATYFLQWTANNGLHLITVLHQNKADNNARGHVGSELTNKAETVISVEVDKQDKTVSIVEPAQCRGMDFQGFAFTINDAGMPELLPDYEMAGKGSASKKAFDPYQYPAETHHKVLTQVFKAGDINSRDEYIQQTKVGWGAMGESIGDNSAKLAMGYWQQMGWATNVAKAGKKAVYQYQSKEGGLGGQVV